MKTAQIRVTGKRRITISDSVGGLTGATERLACKEDKIGQITSLPALEPKGTVKEPTHASRVQSAHAWIRHYRSTKRNKRHNPTAGGMALSCGPTVIFTEFRGLSSDGPGIIDS